MYILMTLLFNGTWPSLLMDKVSGPRIYITSGTCKQFVKISDFLDDSRVATSVRLPDNRRTINSSTYIEIHLFIPETSIWHQKITTITKKTLPLIRSITWVIPWVKKQTTIIVHLQTRHFCFISTCLSIISPMTK